MKYCVVDLETMGTGGNTAIVSIGACMCDVGQRAGPDGQFYRNVSLRSSLKAGLKVTAETVNWWLHQSKEAQDDLFRPVPVELQDALYAFSEFFRLSGAQYLVGNDPSFDNAILADAFMAVGIRQPWKYQANRCLRTYRSLCSQEVENMAFNGVMHNALHDAVHEADILAKCLESLHAKGFDCD